MTQPSLNSQLANAVGALHEANELYQQKAKSAQQARNEETDALNRVNEAQNKFDALVVLVKKEAPRSSDWKRPDGIKDTP